MTVNGEYITLQEFESELARYKDAQAALNLSSDEEAARQVVLEDLIAQVILAQGARQEGFELSESDLQARLQALAVDIGGMQALTNWQKEHGYTAEEFELSLRRAIEATWMRNKIIADVPATADQVHVRQILTYNAENANALKDRLDAGEDFVELASLNDPVAGGELGWFPRGYLLDPQADETVFALQTGEYSEVIETAAGFHVFYILERAMRPLSPDALLTVQENALQEWLKQQREQSEILVLQ